MFVICNVMVSPRTVGSTSWQEKLPTDIFESSKWLLSHGFNVFKILSQFTFVVAVLRLNFGQTDLMIGHFETISFNRIFIKRWTSESDLSWVV